MAMRFYFTELRPMDVDGVEGYYCPLKDTQLSLFNFLDGREFPEIQDGWLFVWTDNTDPEHTAALAEIDITYLPFEDSLGDPVLLDLQLSNVTTANKITIQSEMGDRHIPIGGITNSATVREAITTVLKRIRIIERLRYVDLGNLTTTLSEIPTLRRKAMKRRLTNLGFDVSPLIGTMTVDDALTELFSQNVNLYTTVPVL